MILGNTLDPKVLPGLDGLMNGPSHGSKPPRAYLLASRPSPLAPRPSKVDQRPSQLAFFSSFLTISAKMIDDINRRKLLIQVGYSS